MKRGERGSCQMQMTSLGEGRWGGGEVAVWWGGVGRVLWGGSPVYFFHSESTPSSSLLSLCVTAGVGNVKGRTKTSSLSSPGPHRTPPHLQKKKKKKKKKKKAEPTRRPVGTESEAEHTQTDSTFFFKASQKLLKRQTLCVMQLQNWNYPHTLLFYSVFCFILRGAKICSILARRRVTLFTSCSPHTHWHPNLSGIIQNPNSVSSPARGHENGPTTRRLRGKFLSRGVQFEYKKGKSAAVLAVARKSKTDAGVMHGGRLLSWLPVSGFYYWKERKK